MPTLPKASADDPIQLFPSEPPAYPSLARAVNQVWGETRRAFGELRAEWVEITGLGEPGERAAADAPGDVLAGCKAEGLTPRQRALLDAAIEAFLTTMAGDDRTRAGFAAGETADGILQQLQVIAYGVGVGRASEQMDDAFPTNPALTASQRRRLMEAAFDRLSADGRLRFESRLLDIRDGMVQAFNRGDNPLAIARRLGRDLDGYEQGRLRTIVRTEMGIASEGAARGQYAAAGVQQVEVIGDPTTDAACTSRIGRRFSLQDVDNAPPFHPNCFCSIVPVVE